MSKLHTEAFVEWMINASATSNPVATKAAVNPSRHFVTSVGISFSVASSTIGTMTLSLGAVAGSLIVQIPISQSAPIFLSWTKAMRADVNTAVTATVAGMTGPIVDVFITGYTVRE